MEGVEDTNYYPMDHLMPITLSIEATYFEWLEFRKNYSEWTQACYEMARTPITYSKWKTNLTMCIDNERKRRLDYSL